MRILLQPSSGKAGKENFQDTIVEGVKLNYLKEKITQDEHDYLARIDNNETKVWGVVPNSNGKPKKQWQELSRGDWVIFYADKTLIYIAQVTMKITNKDLALSLWGTDTEGKTWENIFFIGEGKQIQISYKPEVVGYKPNHVVLGVILLDEIQSEKLKEYVEKTGEEFVEESNIKYEPTKEQEEKVVARVQSIRTSQEAESLIEQISDEVKNTKVVERVRTAKVLVRNPKISRLVKEKNKYICQVCGEKPFVQKNGVPYAEAHHIFELSKTRIDSPDHMICVCPRCHRIIHYGNEVSLKEAIKNERIKALING